jgi:ribosome-binding factor A
VFVSLIGDKKAKEQLCNDLNEMAGQIGRAAFRKVVMRTFPKLHFCIDEGLEKQLRICDILTEVLPKEHDESSEDKSE